MVRSVCLQRLATALIADCTVFLSSQAAGSRGKSVLFCVLACTCSGHGINLWHRHLMRFCTIRHHRRSIGTTSGATCCCCKPILGTLFCVDVERRRDKIFTFFCSRQKDPAEGLFVLPCCSTFRRSAPDIYDHGPQNVFPFARTGSHEIVFNATRQISNACSALCCPCFLCENKNI